MRGFLTSGVSSLELSCHVEITSGLWDSSFVASFIERFTGSYGAICHNARMYWTVPHLMSGSPFDTP